MIIVSRDNQKIYSMLEESGNLFRDFSRDKVLSFTDDQDLVLVIYLVIDRSFVAFRAKDYRTEINSPEELSNAIRNENGLSEPTCLAALHLAEEEMQAGNHSRFYFDAH